MLTGPRGLFLTAAQEKVVAVALERVLTTPPVEDLTVHRRFLLRSPCSAAKGQATRPSGSVAEGTLSIILGNGKPKSGSMLDYLGKYPNY